MYIVDAAPPPPPPLPPVLPAQAGRQYVIHNDLPYLGWAGGSDNPSGGNPGAYYGKEHSQL